MDGAQRDAAPGSPVASLADGHDGQDGHDGHPDARWAADGAGRTGDTRDAGGARPRPARGAHLGGTRDWAWRRRIRSDPRSHHVYKWIVGCLGLVVTVAGLLMVPFPGPGWLVVFIGVSIWASEFHWARRLHTYGMDKLRSWNDWVMRQGLWVRTLVVVATCAFVNAVIWTMFKLTGIPGWVPEQARAFMTAHLAL